MSEYTENEVETILWDAEIRGACAVASTAEEKRALDRRVSAGSVACPFPRLYAKRAWWDEKGRGSQALCIMRGLQTLHPGWVFAGFSAAVALGLSVSHRLLDVIEIASPSACSALCGGRVARRYLPDSDVVEASGLRVTSPLQTVFDCMRRSSLGDGLAVADSALRQGLFSKEELVSFCDRAHRGGRGVLQARLCASLADGRSGSGGESIARATMFELGFAMPELQTKVVDPMTGRSYYVDFSWVLPDGSVLYGEHDGGEKYTSPLMNHGEGAEGARQRERLRESRATVGGARLMRFSPKDVRNRAFFCRLLETYGVPRSREPRIFVR